MKLKKELLAAMVAAGVLTMTPLWAAQQPDQRQEDRAAAEELRAEERAAAEELRSEDRAASDQLRTEERAATEERAEEQAAAQEQAATQEEDQAWLETEESDPFAAQEDPMASQTPDPELANMDPPISDDLISSLQEKLNEEGNDLAVDGIWGPETQAALSNYQQEKGLDDTGQLDAETLSELQLEPPSQVASASSEEEVSLFEPADERQQRQQQQQQQQQ